MPIKDKTDYRALNKYIQTRIENIKRAQVRTLKWCAETLINIARDSHTYKDQTGNLTSSMGAVITVDGKSVWESTFETLREGGEGSRQGKEFALSLAMKYPKGVALIVVAGKNYAVHVSNKGYDVLASAELQAERIIPEMLKSLKI